jgi:hypothetical protein
VQNIAYKQTLNEISNKNFSRMKKLIKKGSALYDKSIEYEVAIYETDFRPGSGDSEEEPAWRDDQHGQFFIVDFSSPGFSNIRGDRNSGSMAYYSSLKEALDYIGKVTKNLKWDENF